MQVSAETLHRQCHPKCCALLFLYATQSYLSAFTAAALKPHLLGYLRPRPKLYFEMMYASMVSRGFFFCWLTFFFKLYLAMICLVKDFVITLYPIEMSPPTFFFHLFSPFNSPLFV